MKKKFFENKQKIGSAYSFLFKKLPKILRSNTQGVWSAYEYQFLKSDDFQYYYSHAIKFARGHYPFQFRLHQALWCAAQADKTGIFVELGTGKGFTFSAVSEFLMVNNHNTKCYLFDTFLPFKTDRQTGEQTSGKISSFYTDDFDAIAEAFSIYPNVALIRGKCPESLKTVPLQNISFVHVDLNYHLAEVLSLEYLWPLCMANCIFLLDDYANEGRGLQQQAFDSFFEKKGLKILTLASGQGIAFKTTNG